MDIERTCHDTGLCCSLYSKTGLVQKALGPASVSSPHFPVSHLYGQFWDGPASSWKGMAGSCFACEAAECWANALYHPRDSPTQHRSALRSVKGCQSQLTDVPVAARRMDFLPGTHLVLISRRCLCPFEAETLPLQCLLLLPHTVHLAMEMANPSTGPARTSQLSPTQELFFVFTDLPEGLSVCMERCGSVGLLASSLWLGQEY